MDQNSYVLGESSLEGAFCAQEAQAMMLGGKRVDIVFSLSMILLCTTTWWNRPALVAQQGLLSGIAAPEAARLRQSFLPLVSRAPICQPIPDAAYTTLPPFSAPSDRPAEAHPDLNLSIRGYDLTDAARILVDYSSPGPGVTAPQLSDLFGSHRLPVFRSVYRVYDWDWGRMQRGALLFWPSVTALGMQTSTGEILYVPDSGYDIGSGCEVLVLYASTDRITLKYTREDNVVYGYTLHVEQLCVEPSLVSLYQECNRKGRRTLPALRPRQAFGRSRGSEVIIAIRDTGAFMDPRARGDWWLGY